uniref:Predicted protein n=1 Tax=Hordeum vulgare subsp. vulgare TaxID=112509 RepID=F2DS37_HORVV|nr:predicted protein [Hordeum vulgare subsp. vulgare]
MGLVLNSVLLTGDEDELILFWNKDKVRRYQIGVNRGDVVGKKLIVAGFDNRVRMYEVNAESGLVKLHVFVGHVMSIYNLTVIDDGIFTSYSYDGTIRWWNTQVKACFSFFNFKKYFRNDKILCVDLPKFSLEEERHAKFNREGSALILLNASEIVVFDTMRKEVKWRL